MLYYTLDEKEEFWARAHFRIRPPSWNQDWGEEIFAEGVGVKCTSPLPFKHPATIQDGSMEPIYFHSEITTALQASHVFTSSLTASNKKILEF